MGKIVNMKSSDKKLNVSTQEKSNKDTKIIDTLKENYLKELFKRILERKME